MKRMSRLARFIDRPFVTSGVRFPLALLCASVAVGSSFGAFACDNLWPVAPSGGNLDDGGDGASPEGSVNEIDSSSDAGTRDATTTTTEGGSTPEGGSATDGPAPVLPQPSTAIAQGIGFACAINASAIVAEADAGEDGGDAGMIAAGSVSCWGNNDFGQAGGAVTGAVQSVVAHPQVVSGVTGAVAIALGDYHACAVTSAHAVYCWGLDNSGQLAHASGASDPICPDGKACNPVAQLASVPAAVGIAAAGGWTCTVGVDGSVTCWGVVQDGSTPDGSVACPAGVGPDGLCYGAPYAPGVAGVTQLTVAFDHACALAGSSGQVTCWGNNGKAQVAPNACTVGGIQVPSCPPQALSSLPAATAVAAGKGFTCALITDGGTVSCFGDNQYGELGRTPSSGANATPTPVGGLGAVAELVAAGNEAACALADGGVVSCWGNVAAATQAGGPVVITGLPPLTSLGVPDDSYACGVAGDGGVWCWYLVDGGGPAFVQ